MKVVKNWYVVLVLTLIVIAYVIFIFRDNSDIETKLDEVKLKAELNEISKNSFAIMVEKEDGSGYEEVDSFPEGLPLNEELTGCIDIDGKKLENAISYSEGVVTVNVNSTAYCYLYFDFENNICEKEVSLSECLYSTETSGYNLNMEGGLYRYQGTNVDNYICFGTSDKDTCLSNTDAHMYRIIGITSDRRIKVMKNYALNTAYYWHNTASSNTTWPNSDLYKGLNGISGGNYSNLFIGNTSYIPSGWEDKIETTTWKYGDITSSDVNTTAVNLYNTENAWIDTVDAKIGLIYAHDYYYAYQSGGMNCSTSGSICKTSWMHLSISDSDAPSAAEWTMSRIGFFSSRDAYTAWAVNSNGILLISYNLTNTYSIRPVFFLTSSVKYISGSGTSTDPFIIS